MNKRFRAVHVAAGAAAVVLVLVLLETSTGPSIQAQSSDSNPRAEAAAVTDVIPGYQPDTSITITVTYGATAVVDGVELSMEQASAPPSVELSSTHAADVLTLVMVDPDAPSPDNPTAREWLHWLVRDLTPGQDPAQGAGKVLVEYNGPTPPMGKHRYILLVYRQPTGSDPKGVDGGDRAGFHVQQWAEQHGLQGPVALKYYYTSAPN